MATKTASWRFVLARSLDLLPLGELTQARNRSISLKLNDPGSASFTVPMDDDLGQLIQPYTHSLIAYRKGSSSATVVWSGYVSTIEEDISNNRMTVNCVGWLQRLAKSVVHKSYTFTNSDDGDIIFSLVTSASQPGITSPVSPYEFTVGVNNGPHFDGVTVQWPTGSKPNTPTWIKWGGKLPNEGVGGATAYISVAASPYFAGRNMQYNKYQANTLQAITDLLNVENGCDIYVDPMTREFFVFRKRMRARDGSNSAQPTIMFGYGWGPDNIAQIGRQIDSSIVVNSMIAQGGSGTTPALAADLTSQSAYGLVEEVASISDLSGLNANSTLIYYAGSEVLLRKTPRLLYNFTPFNWTSGSSVPEPFVDYRIGDLVKLGVNSPPRIKQQVSVRVFAMSFSIDEQGNEKIGQLQVSP